MDIKASVKILEENEKVILTALGTTDKYISSNIIDNLAKYSPNQPIIYRHVHPASPAEGQILGTVLESKLIDLEDGVKGIEITGEMLQYTQYQQDAVKYIKAKQDTEDPIQISIGFQQYGVDDPVDARPYEFSLTDIPVCEECITYEVNTMINEKKTDEAVIKELQKSLNKIKTENEQLLAKLGNYEKTEKEEISVKQELEDTILAITKKHEEELVKRDEQISALKQEFEMAQKKPYIDKLFRLEKDEELVDWYKGRTLEQLAARVEKKEKEAPNPIVTKTLEESTTGVMRDVNKEMEMKQKARDIIANNPLLNRYVNGDVGAGERGGLI